MSYCTVSTGNNSGLNVRASRSTGSALRGVINNGVSVNVVRCDDTWATLLFNGSPSFVQHQYLTNPPTGKGQGLARDDNAICNDNNVIIRKTAGGTETGSYLQKGDAVAIAASGYINNYYWYRIGDNRWVRGDFLTPATNTTGGGNSSGDNNDDDSSAITINVRCGPGTGFDAIGTITSTTNYTIRFSAQGSTYNNVNTWYYITWYQNDMLKQGYINGSFVTNPVISAERPLDKDEAFGGSTLRWDSYGIYMYNAQLALLNLGYLDSEDDCDGYFGSNTHAAVLEFQEDYYLALDGLIGNETKTALWDEASDYVKANGAREPNG